jgi:uncharacterized RDD family membrane protein YckC
MSTEIVAGWYRDPVEPETQRYWDGEQWVGAPLPADAEPPAGPPSPAPAVGVAQVAPATTAPEPAAAPPHTAWAPQTAESGAAEQGPPGTLAPVLDRLAARLVDVVALGALNIVVNGWFVYQFLQAVEPSVRAIQDGDSTPPPFTDHAGTLFLVILGVATALWFAYEVPAIASTGQTLGKRLVGIRVTTPDGRPVGFGRAIQRWAIPGLPMMLPWPFGHLIQLVDGAWCLRDKHRQCLHDKAAGTLVVRDPATRGA